MYDLIVIGAGPGGYVSAIEAASLGKKVAVIEKQDIGGTCLNVGCIPSKSYLEHAKWVETLQEANQFGIENQINTIHFDKLVARKNSVVNQLQQGINYLFKQHKIDYFEGEASIFDPRHVLVGGKTLETTFILLATGSRPFVPPINGIETVDYLTTDTFFDVSVLPKELVIIGGGVIGIELAFAMAPLGTKVSVVEVASDILLTEDKAARDLIKKELKKMDVSIHTTANIKEVKPGEVILEKETLSFDQLLVVTGRRANLEIIEGQDIEKTEDGKKISVNHLYQTTTPNIYAIGDITPGYMLAHVASKDGIKAVRNMFASKELPVKNEDVPKCVYTHPEIASFGLNEEEAREKGHDVIVSSIPYSSNGRAIAGNVTDGFIKIIATKEFGDILGAVIVGSQATEMIHTILAVKASEGTLSEIEDMIFAHPTLSEMIGELSSSMI